MQKKNMLKLAMKTKKLPNLSKAKYKSHELGEEKSMIKKKAKGFKKSFTK